MAASEASISAVVLPSWVKAAARCGFNIEPIFQRHGITLDLIQLNEASVSLPALEGVIEDCIGAAGDHHFPFVVGETFAFEYLPDLETYLTTSSSLRDAARVLEWIPALINPTIDAQLIESAQRAHLVLRHVQASRVTRPYEAEMFFATILKFVRALIGNDRQLRSLHFEHAAPSYAERYAMFFDLPVLFNQTGNELIFDRALLDQPLEGNFPELHSQAAELVEARIARASRRDVAGHIHRAFVTHPSLLAYGIDAMSRHLAMQTRTLQRRLGNEQTTFAQLHDDARFAHARQMLRLGDDLESISEQLGFSDRRSFTRAFRRWSGTTPSQYRG